MNSEWRMVSETATGHSEGYMGFGPPMDMKVPPTCHSDPAGAGKESASLVFTSKADSSSLRSSE
jgi:hypothetical protein